MERTSYDELVTLAQHDPTVVFSESMHSVIHALHGVLMACSMMWVDNDGVVCTIGPSMSSDHAARVYAAHKLIGKLMRSRPNMEKELTELYMFALDRGVKRVLGEMWAPSIEDEHLAFKGCGVVNQHATQRIVKDHMKEDLGRVMCAFWNTHLREKKRSDRLPLKSFLLFGVHSTGIINGIELECGVTKFPVTREEDVYRRYGSELMKGLKCEDETCALDIRMFIKYELLPVHADTHNIFVLQVSLWPPSKHQHCPIALYNGQAYIRTRSPAKIECRTLQSLAEMLALTD